MKRSPLKRKAPLKSSSTLVRKPVRRTAHRVQPSEFLPYVKFQAATRAGFTCEFPGCTRVIECYHHIQLKSQGGQGTLDNCKPLCHKHHRYIHDHPAESYANDWMRHAPVRG